MTSAQLEKRLLILVPACITILHVISVFRLDGNVFALISLLYIPLRFYSWSTLSFVRRPAGITMQGSVDLAFFCWIALYPTNLVFIGVSDKAMGISMVIGVIVLMIHAVTNTMLREKLPVPVFTQHYWPEIKNDYVWIAFLGLWVTAFVLIFISHMTGIAVMGVEVRTTEILPFRLAGILSYLRIYAVPMFGILFIDYFFERRIKGMFYLAIVLLLVFSMAEAYIRLSRGVIIINTIGLLIWALYRGKYNAQYILLCCGILSGVTLIYPYLSRLRRLLSEGDYGQGIGGTLKELIENRSLFGQTELSFLDNLYAVLIRGASEGMIMSKFLDHLNFDILRGNLELTRTFHNVANYHTRVVDGVPANVPHSSGITLFTDSLFIGGIGLVVLTAVVYSLLAYLIDARKLGIFTSTPAIQASVCFFYFTTFIGGVISKVILGKPEVILVLLFVWMGMYYLTKLMDGVPGGTHKKFLRH